MRTISGVIFDFNGTLFWDTHYHDLAWDHFLNDHHLRLSNEEKHLTIHGKTNQDIFRFLFGQGLTNEKMGKMIQEKEKIYRNLCFNGSMTLAPGAEPLLDWLKKEGVPMTIATASGWENLSFYLENLPLQNWFLQEKIVFNDGSFVGKPQPDIFIKAASNLDVPVEQIMIFEDSAMGILAAENAGVKKICIVKSNEDDYSHYRHDVIKDFSEVDRALFIDKIQHN